MVGIVQPIPHQELLDKPLQDVYVVNDAVDAVAHYKALTDTLKCSRSALNTLVADAEDHALPQPGLDKDNYAAQFVVPLVSLISSPVTLDLYCRTLLLVVNHIVDMRSTARLDGDRRDLLDHEILAKLVHSYQRLHGNSRKLHLNECISACVVQLRVQPILEEEEVYPESRAAENLVTLG